MPVPDLVKVPGLPPARTWRVSVRHGVSVRMRDGVILRADHYAPRLPSRGDGAVPAVLVRTPYPRGGPVRIAARVVAAQGFHVVVQSCRGTADSGGTFDPLIQERDDGLDTIAWLRLQPWYGGTFGMYGPSYVGFTQWAVAADAGPDLQALVTIVTSASFRDSTYAGGGFSFDSVLAWNALLALQKAPRREALLAMVRGQPGLRRGLAHPVLAEADVFATGARVPHFQEWLRESDPAASYWRERSHDHRLGEVTAPVLMIGGWYDIFLPWQVTDYARLRAAGREPRLHIGPWHHGSTDLFLGSVQEGVRFLRAHLYGETHLLREEPVRFVIGGTREWVDAPAWPPPFTRQTWTLTAGGGLAPSVPGDATSMAWERHFRYDPRHPTPSVGGPMIIAKDAGPRDNRALESRPDVLTWTSDPLTTPLELSGPVQASIRMRSSVAHWDVFVRLCDVWPDGRSINVCDGLTRVDGATDEEVAVPMWPTAYRFAAGHRLRVQVSGGAHPRWSRNPGTGAALDADGPMVASDRIVLPGSAVHLPQT